MTDTAAGTPTGLRAPLDVLREGRAAVRWLSTAMVDHANRMRLNRSGHRQLNQALHVIVLTRLRYDPATRADAQRRRAQGKTNREIRRCLVRYVARQLYRLLEARPAL